MCRRNMSREESPEITVVLEKPSPIILNSKIKYKKEVSCNDKKFKNKENKRTCDENVSKDSICVISEVVGNATKTFMQSEPVDKQLLFIKPQKTNDITKIKGWRTKQFIVKKPTTVEPLGSNNQPSSSLKNGGSANKCTTTPNVAKAATNSDLQEQPSCSKEVERDANKKLRRKQLFVEKPTVVEFFCGENTSSSTLKIVPESIEDLDPGNKENAFFCNGLDYFLDNEAELKLNYEIPHLYAEVGIKLTKDDVFSKPNLSEKDFKEVETKYCVPLKTELSDSELGEIERGWMNRIEEEEVKVIESEDSRRRKIRIKKYVNNSYKKKKPENVIVTQEFVDLLNNLNLVRKCIGVEIFPKLGKPLHPILRQHLNKLRSYHTKIDKEWANFATSVVCPKGNREKRFILPVYICAKVEDEPAKQNEEPEIKIISEKINKVYSKPPTSQTVKVSKLEKLKPKKVPKKCSNKIELSECRVVLERIKTSPNTVVWCMDHSCYGCKKCGLPRSFSNNELTFEESKSVQGTFKRDVAVLLAKKLKHIKLKKDVLVGIDSLKRLKPNVLELIKLNFIKKSFLSDVISIWYLVPKSSSETSRAFLTFSQTPPVPNAINIKNKEIPRTSLPKVITDIMSAQDLFESNEYAILHCNGHLWEIHGSLSLGFEKNETESEKNVEQIFSVSQLSELENLQNLSRKILNVRCSKWWILDLNQKFFELKIKTGPQTDVMIPKKFFKLDSLDFKFMPLRKYESGRTLGAYMLQNLMPYVLIGPFHLFENHELYLEKSSSPLPFMYFGEESTSSNSSLKFFIKSVISEYETNGKKLCGLWLYDKTMLDSTCYLEVNLVANSDYLTPKKYSIEIEHGYSIKSGSSSSQTSTDSSIVSSKNKTTEVPKKITVYLYFEVFDLGYIVGELQPNNSIIISHPLDQKTKVKSHNIGNWFIEMLRKKVYFIPVDLTVMSFITRHKEDLRDRLPFNKFILGGAHILCKKGLFFMLELTEDMITELDLDKREVAKAINSSKSLTEVKELKNLANIVLDNSNMNDSLPLEQILTTAITRVQEIKKGADVLERTKNYFLSKKLKLVSTLLVTLVSSNLSLNKQMEILMKVKSALVDESDNVYPECIPLLKEYGFIGQFLPQFKSEVTQESDNNCTKVDKKIKKLEKNAKQIYVKNLEKKFKKLTSESKTKNSNSPELKKVLKKMKIILNKLQSIKIIFKKGKKKKKKVQDKSGRKVSKEKTKR